MSRLRLVATGFLALGIVLCTSVLVTRGLGYAPDPTFAQVFSAMWPIGLVLAVLGTLLRVAVWVLHGFIVPASVAAPPVENRGPRGPLGQ